MKNERILLYSDSHKKADFENEIEATQMEANRLISLWHAFQPWDKINSIDQFENLCVDPVKAMDQTLINHSGFSMEATGGKQPAADMVAKILDIDRENWVNVIKGLKTTEGCKSCNKTPKIIKNGKGVLSFQAYKQYAKYLLWDNGQSEADIDRVFEINESAVFEKLKSFDYYIEDSISLEVYNYWHDLNNILNLSYKKGYLSDADLIEISKRLKNRLLFSYQSYSLSVNDQELFTEIDSLRSIKSLKN